MLPLCGAQCTPHRAQCGALRYYFRDRMACGVISFAGRLAILLPPAKWYPMCYCRQERAGYGWRGGIKSFLLVLLFFS
jgi:hypothetical protein